MINIYFITVKQYETSIKDDGISREELAQGNEKFNPKIFKQLASQDGFKYSLTEYVENYNHGLLSEEVNQSFAYMAVLIE